jgi:hypothetical protein
VPISLNLIMILLFNAEAKTARSEMRNGMYSPLAYFLGTTTVQVPYMLLIAFAACAPAFAIGNWPWEQFFTFLIVYWATYLAFESMAQTFSVAFDNPLVGMLMYIQIWSAAILFTGLVFNGEDVIWPFRLFYYIMPLQWTFNGCAYDIFMPEATVYPDALPCTPGDTMMTSLGATNCAPGGFYCPNATNVLLCLGNTGHQILDTLGMRYDALGSADNRLRNVVILLGITAYFKLAHIFILVQGNRSAEMQKDKSPKVITGTKSSTTVSASTVSSA